MFRAIALLILFVGVASVAHAQPNNASKTNPDVAATVEGNNQFAFDLYAHVAQKPGNTFFSPYSISSALAMTYAGARGQTATDMAKTLHFTVSDQQLNAAMRDIIGQLQPAGEKDRPFKLHTVNRIWAANGLKVLPAFQHITQNDYHAGIQQLDFVKNPDAGRKTINQWVEEQTNNKIKDLLTPGTIQKDTRMVLTNAIYFKADWMSQFEKNATHPEEFKVGGTEKVKVPMMNQTLRPSYVDNTDYQLVQLGYKGNEVAMVVILPRKADGLGELEKKLSAKALGEVLAKAKPARVHLTLPKFKMTEEFKLRDALAALGMGRAFSNQADFSGLAEGEEVKIDNVIHKAFVEVDEKGTEAAAATAVTMMAMSMPVREQPPIPFKADHPFLFVIRHNATGEILFLGRVNDPR